MRREKLTVEAWSREFGGTEGDAAQLVEASPDEPDSARRHCCGTLRNRSHSP